MENPEPELLTIREFGDRFRVSRTQTYRLIERGELRLRKMGVSSRISLADARAWADRLPIVQQRPL